MSVQCFLKRFTAGVFDSQDGFSRYLHTTGESFKAGGAKKVVPDWKDLSGELKQGNKIVALVTDAYGDDRADTFSLSGFTVA